MATALLTEIHHRSPQGHSRDSLFVWEHGTGRPGVRQFENVTAIAQKAQLNGMNSKLYSEERGERSVMINDTDGLCSPCTTRTRRLMWTVQLLSPSTG